MTRGEQMAATFGTTPIIIYVAGWAVCSLAGIVAALHEWFHDTAPDSRSYETVGMAFVWWPCACLFWPLMVVVGSACWAGHTLKRKAHPVLRIPNRDLRRAR